MDNIDDTCDMGDMDDFGDMGDMGDISFNWRDLTIVFVSFIVGHYICKTFQVTLATIV